MRDVGGSAGDALWLVDDRSDLGVVTPRRSPSSAIPRRHGTRRRARRAGLGALRGIERDGGGHHPGDAADQQRDNGEAAQKLEKLPLLPGAARQKQKIPDHRGADDLQTRHVVPVSHGARARVPRPHQQRRLVKALSICWLPGMRPYENGMMTRDEETIGASLVMDSAICFYDLWEEMRFQNA